MTVFNNNENLPGVLTEVEADYSYGYDTSLWGTTDSVAVIGTAFDGPVGQPTPVYSPEHAGYVFGKVYDSTKKEEASLVAGVQDAWDRGCRTIYAIRIGGKELYKDYNFCIYSKFKLRVSSMFPSNLGKETYFHFDNTVGNETLTFFKPASRATIAEKKRGEVQNVNSVLSTELRLAMDYGIGRDSKLVEMIRLVNDHSNNNVLKLSIVDADGVDMTDSTEAYEIPIGVIFPGVYFVGRDKSICDKLTETKFQVVDSATATPYSDFNDTYFRKLELNTDVSQPLPIYANSANMAAFRDILRSVNVVMSKPFDFLSVANITDRAFALDDIDYEETKLSSFEMYKRLGNGFAITAKATMRKNSKGEVLPRISETPMSDTANRVQPIVDGIYGTLEDAEIKYRVVTCVNADEKISGKLPKADDFKKAIAQEISVLNNCVTLTPKVDPADRTKAKAYAITFADLDDPATDNTNEIYIDEVFPIIAFCDKLEDISAGDMPAGTQLMYQNAAKEYKLGRVSNDGVEGIEGAGYRGKHFIVNNSIYEGDFNATQQLVFKPVVLNTDATDPKKKLFKTKEYVLGSHMDSVSVFQVIDMAEQLLPLGDFSSMINRGKEDSMLLAYAESLPFKKNNVMIKSTMMDVMTLEELVEAINVHPLLSRLFTATLTEDGSAKKDDIVTDVCPATDKDPWITYDLASDRTIGYDYNLYIPYRTTDNFARQLAQHCTYTELKTCPTHGFIGCERLTDVSLTSVAKRVANLSEVNFDLYAKTNYGRNMLDRNNYPYPIGKNVSVVFGQYFISIDDENYRYVSSGGAGYAGMVSTLPLDQSSTSQHIKIDATTFNLTPSQLKSLTAKGIVTFKKSFTKGIVVTDGITMAPVDSAFRRLAASRIVGAVEELIRQAAEPFIGKQNHAANRNSLYTAIKSRLEKIKGTLIETYVFNMILDPKVLKFSYISINYTIVPIYEIREIRNNITVKDSLDSASATVS